MAYTKVSIPRFEAGGAPTVKKATVILVDINDVDAEPTRTLGNTQVVGALTLKTGAKAVGIYATPSTIVPTEETSGEVDSRGFIQGLEYVHPGNSIAIANHTEAFLNRPVIALVRECSGSASGKTLIIGSICNPLYLNPEYTNSKDGSSRKFVWKQDQPSKYVIGTYTGALPTLANEVTEGSGSGEGSA